MNTYIVRTRMSGVWVNAQLADLPEEINQPGALAITGRRLWQWNSGALELTQIATEGISDARIGPPAELVVLRWEDVAELQLMTPRAIEKIMDVEPDRG